MASLLLLQPQLHSSTITHQKFHKFPSNSNPKIQFQFLNFKPKFSITKNALTDSSNSPKSIDPPDPQFLLQELAVLIKTLVSISLILIQLVIKIQTWNVGFVYWVLFMCFMVRI